MAYGVFASFYDGLTENVDYIRKADFICEILKRFSHDPGITLDLACGTGTLTLELKKRGIDVFGVDASYDMLTQAQEKAGEQELDILFIRQKMQSLELYGKIDTCISTLDSLSHLKGINNLKKTFERVSYYMDEGGMFVFDVNTPYKHREILGNNTFVYDTDEVFLVWQNTYFDEDCSVLIELDMFSPDGGRYIRESESFKEYAYPHEVIEELLKEVGFEVLAVYDDTDFSEPNDTSQRLTFAARKNSNI